MTHFYGIGRLKIQIKYLLKSIGIIYLTIYYVCIMHIMYITIFIVF